MTELVFGQACSGKKRKGSEDEVTTGAEPVSSDAGPGAPFAGSEGSVRPRDAAISPSEESIPPRDGGGARAEAGVRNDSGIVGADAGANAQEDAGIALDARVVASDAGNPEPDASLDGSTTAGPDAGGGLGADGGPWAVGDAGSWDGGYNVPFCTGRENQAGQTPGQAGGQTGESQKLDLLFVIDSSASMKEEQDNLAKQLPRLVRILTKGDLYVDGGRPANDPEAGKFKPVSSLQLAVITSELGALSKLGRGEALLAPCLDDATNDDGKFQRSTSVAKEEGFACPDVEAPYQLFETTGRTPTEQEEQADAIAQKFACVVRVGTSGCAYEQPLEAMWKALAPETESDFLGTSTRGHGKPTGVNAGFVRDDAVLAIIHVTDEDDCSITAAGRTMLEGDDVRSHPSQNMRCGSAASETDLLRPASRYVEKLASLKQNDPSRVLFIGIVGIGEALEGKPYDQMLADPTMQFQPDPETVNTPSRAFAQSSCTVRRAGGPLETAFPPRRFVEVAKGLAPNSALLSICREEYTEAVTQIIERIAAKTSQCVPHR